MPAHRGKKLAGRWQRAAAVMKRSAGHRQAGRDFAGKCGQNPGPPSSRGREGVGGWGGGPSDSYPVVAAVIEGEVVHQAWASVERAFRNSSRSCFASAHKIMRCF